MVLLEQVLFFWIQEFIEGDCQKLLVQVHFKFLLYVQAKCSMHNIQWLPIGEDLTMTLLWENLKRELAVQKDKGSKEQRCPTRAWKQGKHEGRIRSNRRVARSKRKGVTAVWHRNTCKESIWSWCYFCEKEPARCTCVIWALPSLAQAKEVHHD